MLSECLDESQRAQTNQDFLSKASHMYLKRIFNQLEESWKLATASDLRCGMIMVNEIPKTSPHSSCINHADFLTPFATELNPMKFQR